MNKNAKRVVISCGPIPARLDSVKYVTNRFKGGLALHTARYLIEQGYDVTVVAWEHTHVLADIDNQADRGEAHIVKVKDVYDYYDWFAANAANYDAFVMAAAVANLAPVAPRENKFPSHLYKPGYEFDIKFCITPRAIDVIKQVNPRACLIGYKLLDSDEEELIRAGRITLEDSKANVVFANTPQDARYRKIALTQDGAAIEMDFKQHLEFIRKAIDAEYYRTEIQPLTDEEAQNPDIRQAMAIAKLYEQTFPKYGTVAVPVKNMNRTFVTTSRGHKGEPVLVRSVDHNSRIVTASAKATLNAPALETALTYLKGWDCKNIIVHRHEDDPRYTPVDTDSWATKFTEYQFPGTTQEVEAVRSAALLTKTDTTRIVTKHHGDLSIKPVGPVDWNKYYDQFPAKYFDKTGYGMQTIADAVQKANDAGVRTLELGCNHKTDCTVGYDPYATINDTPQRQVNLAYVEDTYFGLAVCRNAINYISPDVLRTVLHQSTTFIANTFLQAPDEKITDREAAVLDKTDPDNPVVRHALLLQDDSLAIHQFYAYDQAFYESLGLTVTPYSNNSALVSKGLQF